MAFQYIPTLVKEALNGGNNKNPCNNTSIHSHNTYKDLRTASSWGTLNLNLYSLFAEVK